MGVFVMDLLAAARARHSVRSYTNEPIEGEVLSSLHRKITECNEAGGLRIQLFLNSPGVFSGVMARYGSFYNVRNYIALVGKRSPELGDLCGYYGEQLVLHAQQLGLNTCWVAMTYKKRKCPAKCAIGEKLMMVIALGYGESSGTPSKTKPVDELSRCDGEMPDWFRRGVEAAQLAPTAMNQQKFMFELHGDKVRATTARGFYTLVDLGIAKYHFELGAGTDGWSWE